MDVTKGKRLAALIIFALIVSFTTGLTSLADNNGWQLEGESWYYYQNGKMVTSEWVKDGELWYYLSNNGAMTRNGWINSTYYVGEDGVRVMNQWRKLKADSGSSEHWYYFGTDGARINNSWQTINGSRYFFDNRGRMHTGWYGEEYYFGTGDDGAMKTGWVKLLPPYSSDKGVEDNEDNRRWYYFQDNGKLYNPEVKDGHAAVTKTLDGETYAFNKEGQMLYGWVNISGSSSSTSIKDYKYFGESNDGRLKADGWYYIKAPDKVAKASKDSDLNWFYLGAKGVPKNTSKTSGFTKSDLTTIDGVSYLFDQYGIARHGLTWIGGELYYLGTKDQCYMQTGYFENLSETKNKSGTFYFTESGSGAGKGYTGVYNEYLFYQGKLQSASSSQKFTIIRVSNKNYVINTSGMIQADATVVAGDNNIYRTNSSGVLTYINNKSISSGTTPSDNSNIKNPVKANVSE